MHLNCDIIQRKDCQVKGTIPVSYKQFEVNKIFQGGLGGEKVRFLFANSFIDNFFLLRHPHW